ncbi:xanthine dehydrogenase/oxidase-like [Epargyreus clarus]|uniref:xanthine dehydrogenase/oxidase-like n=1 Tax=Epargyreus clarus TaxID=520877 RepID=UPI003C2AEB45
MDRITFSVNGTQCSVGHEVDSDVSLNDYLRCRLHLPGTKYMCKEGGCGSCIVSVVAPAPDGTLRHISVNSCLVSVTSCQDWRVTTVEGLGSRQGYHPVQRALADHNGSQCGYCSPGWVMSMYSLLEANNYDLTQYEIENSFGSNTCRCTGYRPILDAFKSFAKDAPKPKSKLHDIEDLDICKKQGKCNKTCESWCFVAKKENPVVKKINLKDDRVWYRVHEIKDIFDIFNTEGTSSYMLVNGNTGRGASPIFAFPRVLIDIQPVDHLKMHYIDQNLVLGAGIVLSDVMRIFQTLAHDKEEFSYLQKLYEHLDLVAHIPVRNIGSIGGNLMVKHRQHTFSSDVFLLLESVGATLTIMSAADTIEVTPEHFLSLDMTGKLITNIKLPPLSKNYKFVSFKIMPRSQNAHASVNAAFLYQFDHHQHGLVLSARIVYGGLSGEFVHARITEDFLVLKNIFTNETLQGALVILAKELTVEEIAGEFKPEYRKKAALGLFYKGLLNLIPEAMIKPCYRSGARDMRKTRPLSCGTEVYDTNPIIWPVNEPMPKVEALIQCSGEAHYVNDVPNEPQEVFCALVTSDICVGEIESVDPSPAMELPGVLAFFTAKDIPGINSFIPSVIALFSPEGLLSDGKIMYYDQPIGIIVAETEKLANRAALLVNVKYKVDKNKPIITIRDARERDTSRISTFMIFPARDRGTNVQKVIKDCENIFWQYHYSMETQSCISRPSDDGIDVQSATQWLDLTHISISSVLKLEQSRINVSVPRCGGAYGAKISRATMIAAACSLVTYLMNRPCRFVMSMQANMRVIGKRFPSTLDYEVGVSDTGEIQYLEYHLFEDAGYMAGEPVIYFSLSAVKNCYDNRRWQYKFYTVNTDTPTNVYARAPGALEAIAMTEHMMEHIAWELDRDPVEIRLNNLNPEYSDVLEVTNTLLQDSEYYKRRQEVEQFNKLNRWKKRGLSLVMMSWPATNLIDFHVHLAVFHGDGTVIVKHGGTEIGQGMNTKVIQTVAYTLKISMDKIKVKPSDVNSNPNSYITGGSRATQAVCIGAIKCCQLLLDRLMPVRETLTNPTWEQLIQAAFEQGINLQTSYQVTSNDQQPHRSAGAAVCEVELDILTGEHDIRRVDIIEDVGSSLNPELDIGQIEGAFVMGLGYWTHEHLIYDEHTGELLTDRSWYYHVPLAKDIPIDFRVQLRRNSYNPIGTLGSKAVAEPPICLAVSVAFALKEAIRSSREDTGFPRTEWFNVDGPYTLEANVLHSHVKLEEFLFE